MACCGGNKEQTGEVIVILIAPPGGGKGTQAKLLVERFGFQHFATGDMLREEIGKSSKIGLQIKEIVARGELVSDDLVGGLVKDRLAKSNGCGVVLDGFPRTWAQAEYLQAILSRQIVCAVRIVVKEEDLLRRITGRRFCSECGNIYNMYFSPPRNSGECDKCGAPLRRRRDDYPSVVEERLHIYAEQTRPVVEFYRTSGRYFEVNGNQQPDQVASDIHGIVEALGK